MVIHEKTLVRQMKEAYKTYGYTVAVRDGRMMLTNGYWLANIDKDNVPAGLLGMLAEHIRDVPKEGQAYKVIKDKDGAPADQSKAPHNSIPAAMGLCEYYITRLRFRQVEKWRFV